MTKSSLLLLLFSVLFFTSCVPIEDLIYLQQKKESQESTVIPMVVKPYKLQTNDIISINIKAIDPKLVAIFNPSPEGDITSVHSEQDLYFNGYTVDDHGNIRVPVLGEVPVLGLTLDEVRIKLEKELLAKYFNAEADIFVSAKLAGFRYTVNGEVGSPGSKTLFKEKVNVMEAIASSGDITVVGDRKNVVIIRQLPQGAEMHELDLTDADVMQSPYYYLTPNDFIYVKPLRQKTWGTGKTVVESLTSIMLMLSLITTTLLLTKNL